MTSIYSSKPGGIIASSWGDTAVGALYKRSIARLRLPSGTACPNRLSPHPP
eukprot:CAMPEP_0194335540 /NCGR_PEP_ID=MMETSP0171-20130528/69972_1 /TAXON_ID=218684 /ORGANISM="Corethron pennatum, Strain L29A3" /LENGTH=50 /DNA_ID=CAMNT_0039098675 /DNA_START=46 /DNA_END=195 /DNA_ORIENTATION=+